MTGTSEDAAPGPAVGPSSITDRVFDKAGRFRSGAPGLTLKEAAAYSREALCVDSDVRVCDL